MSAKPPGFQEFPKRIQSPYGELDVRNAAEEAAVKAGTATIRVVKSAIGDQVFVDPIPTPKSRKKAR